MSTGTKTSLKSVAWFRATAKPESSGIGSALAKFAVCAVVGLLFFAAHHTALAIAVVLIGFAIFAIGAVSSGARTAIDSILGKFGHAAGAIIGGLLLALLYLLFFTPARFIRRLMGIDDLHLRDPNRLSFWLPCDADARKVRYVSAMFATETRSPRGRPLLAMIVGIILLFGLSEGLLRVMHYGEPITYVADPLIGYYPQPNMTVLRSGGMIHTNQYGMRSSDIDAKKPDGIFRILMLGDSTQYGGSYIDQNELYTTRLEKQLNQRLGGPKVQVLAACANGWGPFQERGYIAHFGTFGADLAIIDLPIDDVNRPLYGLMDVPFFAEQTPPRFALEEVMNHFIWLYRARHSGLDDKWEAQQSQIGIREYGNLVDDLRHAGCDVMLAVLPTRDPGFGGAEPFMEAKWRGELDQTVEAHGAKTYFAKGLFAGKGTPDQVYHDNVHLLAPGHAAYADFLESQIVADSQRFRRFAAKGAP